MKPTSAFLRLAAAILFAVCISIPSPSLAFMTSAGDNPSVYLNMKVNGFEDTASVAYGKKVKVTWESKGVEDCELVYPTKEGDDQKRVDVKEKGKKQITAYPSSSPSQIYMVCDVEGGGGKEGGVRTQKMPYTSRGSLMGRRRPALFSVHQRRK